MITAQFNQSLLPQSRDRLGRFAKRLVEDVEAALAAGVEEGADTLRAGLLNAHTMTGQRRVESGKGDQAGRYVTGTMYDAVKTNADHPVVEGDRITFAFGWFPEDWQAYFGLQEEGTDKIPPAMAMPPAIEAAIQKAYRGFAIQGLRL